MNKPRVCVLRTAGTNCDKETAFAFSSAGAESDLVHVNALASKHKFLDDYQVLALPGGFSYGDDIASGKVFANELKCKLADSLNKFVSDGKLIIGICNGFQILVKSGILPGNSDFRQEVTLSLNDSAKFEDRLVYLSVPDSGRRQTKCVWTKDLPEVIHLPVAHGEGKFIPWDQATLERLKENDQIVFQYCDDKGKTSGYPDNPNGSVDNIAGICDATGRILGLMPHPERHLDFYQSPNWTGLKKREEGDGLQVFKNGVDYVKKYL